jgi:hypothetical protein
MRQHYRQIKPKQDKNDSNEDNDETEVSLAAFKGVCFKCKKKGHRANKCPERGKGKHDADIRHNLTASVSTAGRQGTGPKTAGIRMKIRISGPRRGNQPANEVRKLLLAVVTLELRYYCVL